MNTMNKINRLIDTYTTALDHALETVRKQRREYLSRCVCKVTYTHAMTEKTCVEHFESQDAALAFVKKNKIRNVSFSAYTFDENDI